MRRTEVPATYEAFAAEKKQAFFELLTNPRSGLMVSIEAKEDVSVEIDGCLELIQVRSATKESTQPLADGYGDFWKTLSHWIDKTKQYKEYEITKYRYSVSSECNIRTGTVVDSFAIAQSVDEAKTILDDVRTRYKTGALSISETFAKNILADENRDIILTIIVRFSFEIHRDFQSELKEIFFNRGSSNQSHSDAIFNSINGWLDDQIAPLTQKGEPAHIHWDEYHNELIRQAGRFATDPLAETVTNPDADEIAQEAALAPVYLRQLDLIDVGDDQKIDAVIDSLRCSKQINDWAQLLEIAKPGLTQYDDALFAKWNSIANLCRLEESDEKIAGKKTYYRTKGDVLGLPLQGRPVPPFISHGRLSSLASNPPLSPRVGWHPRYKEELGGNSKDSENE